MQYLLTPLDYHVDEGLGATGDMFEESANLLLTNASSGGKSDVKLPICFLFRHAIELYLKSIVVVLHKGLKKSYGDRPYTGMAHVSVNGQWKPIYTVHSVAALWDHVLQVIHNEQVDLKAKCRTDWQDVPSDLMVNIKAIEEMDGAGTLFRYPDQRRPDMERIKHSWKRKSIESLQAPPPVGAKPMKLTLLFDQDEAVSNVFEYDDTALDDVLELLKETADMLSGMHVGLRVELVGGF